MCGARAIDEEACFAWTSSLVNSAVKRRTALTRKVPRSERATRGANVSSTRACHVAPRCGEQGLSRGTKGGEQGGACRMAKGS